MFSNIFNSCGNSSKPVFRKKLPNLLCLFFSETFLEASYKVLNLYNVKILPFKPGLVGGHCIGVDPYYLTYKAKSIGYHPNIILSGREINDNMGNHVASEMIKEMEKKKIKIKKLNKKVSLNPIEVYKIIEGQKSKKNKTTLSLRYFL